MRLLLIQPYTFAETSALYVPPVDASREARLGLEVYFADPHSPWQRGSCENTNGLLREYLPKGSDLTRHSQDDLNAIALRLNTRPRVRLKGVTPLECFTQMIEFDRLNQPKPQ